MGSKTTVYMTRPRAREDAKGGGSRGGVAIGRTSGGEPIHASHGHPGHKDFSLKEHKEAVKANSKKIEELRRKTPQAAEGFKENLPAALEHGIHAEKAERLQRVKDEHAEFSNMSSENLRAAAGRSRKASDLRGISKSRLATMAATDKHGEKQVERAFR